MIALHYTLKLKRKALLCKEINPITLARLEIIENKKEINRMIQTLMNNQKKMMIMMMTMVLYPITETIKGKINLHKSMKDIIYESL